MLAITGTSTDRTHSSIRLRYRSGAPGPAGLSKKGRAAGSVLSQQAQIERAYYLWKSGEKAQALSTLERFIKLHPTSPALDYALYLQGLVNFNENLGLLGSLTNQDLSERDQQASRDAYQSFRQLTEQFPQSAYGEDARLRMNYIVNSLAAYEALAGLAALDASAPIHLLQRDR